jgi:hypothetical protein
MHGKIVENWLTKVGELTFTVPFCQLLLSKGYRIVHISSQGPMEQGKDVIAVDRDGRIHCYQLKSGNISGRIWGEIKSEIDDLVELPPKHPSLPAKVEYWEAYLVTNGTIANPAARTIHDYAESKREKGHQPLKTIVAGELVRDFTEHFGDFMPVEIRELQQFLDLYNEDGENDLPCEKFKQYFENYYENFSNGSRQKKCEAIRAALILCTYMLTYKHAAGNRIAAIKAYVLLLASTYHYTETNGLNDKLWRDTEQLIYEAIEIEFRQLIDDLDAHPTNFVESKYGLLSETITYKLRCNEIVGYLAAYLNYCTLRNIAPHCPAKIEAALKTANNSVSLVGECVVPLMANSALLSYASGRQTEAFGTWSALLKAVLEANAQGALGLPSPYYSMSQAVEWALGIGDYQIRESFQLRSFCLKSIILVLARMGKRDVLSAAWGVITNFSQIEVKADTPVDYLLWKIQQGTQVNQFPDRPQSWGNLVAESSEDHGEDLPLTLQSRAYFLPLWMNVMPQRFSHRVVLSLLSSLDAIG